MRTTPLWHLFFGLFVNTYSLPDWNIDTQPGEIAASESLLGNAIENPSIALGSPNGSTNGVNALSSEITIAEDISSDCAPDTKRLPSKQKARRDNMCSADRLQFKNGENGRQVLPITPSGQQGVVGGSSGGNRGGEPQAILRFPGPEDPLPEVFIPEKIRPTKNEEVCPHMEYHVPVCAREVDAYISPFPVAGDTILDPCHPYEPLSGCLFMEGEIGFCCLMAAVAYSDLSQDLLDRWHNVLRPQPGGNLFMEGIERVFLQRIERQLQSGLPNPFKLVGIDCIPMWKRQERTKLPEVPLK